MNNFFTSRRVMVTGGNGFLGRHIVSKLKEMGCRHIIVPRRSRYDLTREECVRSLFLEHPVDIVIHAAGEVGGIGKNRREPGSIFYKNLMMGTLVMEYAKRNFVEKFVYIGSVCSYPEFALEPYQEDEADFWRGLPEVTNRAYGMSKKIALLQAQAYRNENGFNAIYLILANLYGPGDDFATEDNHVIPALIKKVAESDTVRIWGSGRPTRDFLYVKDAADAIVQATMKYDSPAPVNIASGHQISITDLAQRIAMLLGKTVDFSYDLNKPDGQARRSFSTLRAEQEFGWKAKTPFDVGLSETVCYFKSIPKETPVPSETED